MGHLTLNLEKVIREESLEWVDFISLKHISLYSLLIKLIYRRSRQFGTVVSAVEREAVVNPLYSKIVLGRRNEELPE